MTNDDILSEISTHVVKASEKAQVSAQETLRELGALAFQDIPTASMTWSHKIKALELLGKHFGLFDEKRRGVTSNEKIDIERRLLEAIENL